MASYNIEINYFNGSSYLPLRPMGNFANMDGSLTANQIPSLAANKITSGTFNGDKTTEYTFPGNLRIGGNSSVSSGQTGGKLNIGDGDYIHLYESSDDVLEIKAKNINFVTSNTSGNYFTLNGTALPTSMPNPVLKRYNTDYTGTESATSVSGGAPGVKVTLSANPDCGFIYGTDGNIDIISFFSYAQSSRNYQNLFIYFYELKQGRSYFKIANGGFQYNYGEYYIDQPGYCLEFETNTAGGGTISRSYIQSNPNLMNRSGITYHICYLA